MLRRCGSVDKDHIFVIDAFGYETLRLILRVIQSDYLADFKVLEDVNVRCGGVAIPVVLVAYIYGAHKRHELAGYDPVEVTILYLFVMLVLLDVEGLEVVPAVLKSFLKPLKAVDDLALVIALTLAGIAIVQQFTVVGLKQAKRMLSVEFKDDDHECAHQKARIRHLCWASTACIVINFSLALKLIAIEQLSQLAAIPMNH